MSDWSSQEYLDMLGLIPDGKLPQKVIAEDLYEDDEEIQTEKPNWNLESVEEDRPLDDDIQMRRLLSTQEEMTEDLVNGPVKLNELIFGLGKKNKEQKTGKSENEVDDSILKTKEVFSKLRAIEIKRPDLKEKLGGLATEFSWADMKSKVLTIPRSQGKTCAASYAFTLIAALESVQAIENQESVMALSEQQIVDCTFDGTSLNFGCLGGHLENSFKYALNNMVFERGAYPYKGKAQFCQSPKQFTPE